MIVNASARSGGPRPVRDLREGASIRVVLVDPTPVVVQGLIAFLAEAPNLWCVGTASTEREALQVLSQTTPDVVIIAAVIPKLDVAEFIRDAAVAFPTVKFIALGDLEPDPNPTRFIRCGVKGYLLRGCTTAELLKAVRAVARGHSYVASPVASALVDWIQHAGVTPRKLAGPGGLLTDRELDVLEHVARGRSDPEIATTLRVSVRTVESHVHNLYRKLAVHHRAQAMQVALLSGLVPTASTELRLADHGEPTRRD